MAKEEKEKFQKEIKEDEAERDEEVDAAKAIEVARNIIRGSVGSLMAHQFTVHSVKKNGTSTKYVVVCSVVPDIGIARDYYVIRVNVLTGKAVIPIGKGKLNSEGKLELDEIEIDTKWTE